MENVIIARTELNELAQKEEEMKDSTKKEAQRGRKPYVKPGMKKVLLRPEEAVLGGCKTAGGGAGSAGTCDLVLCLTQAS
jgi:hypothetical protein